jgi:hypothetical protein
MNQRRLINYFVKLFKAVTQSTKGESDAIGNSDVREFAFILCSIQKLILMQAYGNKLEKLILSPFRNDLILHYSSCQNIGSFLSMLLR